VPQENWEEALAKGYKPVSHTVMYSPDGKRGMIPREQVSDYTKQGFLTSPLPPGSPLPIPPGMTEPSPYGARYGGGFVKSTTGKEGTLGEYSAAASVPFMAEAGGSLAQGIRKGAPLIGKTLLGSAGGATVLRPVGAEIGGIFGPRGREIGGEIGAGAGALFGGGLAARGLEVPSRGYLGELLWGKKAPIPEAGSIEEAQLARRNIPLTQVSKIPLGPQPPPGQGQLLGTAAQPGSTVGESVAGTQPRSLIYTPEEAQSEAQMQAIAERRAKERGMQFAGGMTPREGRSVPRYPTRTATEEFSGVKERISLDPHRPPASAPPMAPSGLPQAGPSLKPDETVPSVFQSSSTPELRLDPNPADIKATKQLLGQKPPVLRQEVQEFVTPSKAMQTPEWVAQEKSYELQKARDILRNPMATEEEKAIARARLSGR
jgi:hypothetical protein